jgi:hypothetical protein
MKIKKTFQGELPENRVVNAKSNSATDAYSANYLNDKLNKVVVSPTEPSTGEDVWIKRSSNILKFDDFEKTVNGVTFTMKDQVLHVEGTATAYTQECYLPINLTLEEAMTLTVDWNDDNLVPKASYTYNGTSYYPNLYSQELEPGTYLNQLYFIIASGATVNTDVRFQLERGRGFSGWQPVMEKAILVKNDNDVYEDLIKKSVHVGLDKPKYDENIWIKKSNNLFNKDKMNIVMSHGTTLQVLDTGVKAVLDAAEKYRYAVVKLDNSLLGKTLSISAKIKNSGNNKGLLCVYYGSDANPVQVNTGFALSETGSAKVTLSGALQTSCHGVYLLIYANTSGAPTSAGDYTEYTDLQIEVGEPTEYQPYINNDSILLNNKGIFKDFIPLKKQIAFSTEEQVIGTWIDGRKIYMKVFDLGKMPNGETRTYETGIGIVHIYWWHTALVARDNHPGWPYNMTHNTSIDNYNIKVKCEADFSAYNGYTVLVYTRP